jgi:hypothetical protein
MPAIGSVRRVLTVVVLFAVSNRFAVAQEDKLRVAVAGFEVPSGIERDVGPDTLLNLMIVAGNRSKQYKPVVPTEYLAKVVKQHRAQLGLGIPPAGLRLDPEKIQADILLLPTLAKTARGWLSTASVVDLKTLEPVTVYSAETDETDGWRTLPAEVWRRFALLRRRWTTALDNGNWANRIVVDGGRLFAETRRGLAVYSAVDGKLLWDYRSDKYAPVLVSGDTTYIGTENGRILVACSSATGKEQWRLELQQPAQPNGVNQGKMWLVGQNVVNVVDCEQKHLLWSASLNGFANGGSRAAAMKQQLFVVGDKVARAYELTTGAKSEERNYQETLPNEFGVFGFRPLTMQFYGTTWYAFATVVSREGAKLTLTDLLVRFGPLGQDAQTLRLECDLKRSSRQGALSLDRGQALALVTSARYRDGVHRRPRPEDCLGFDHRLFCCRTGGTPMKVIWQQKFESPGGMRFGSQGLCHSPGHVFVGAGGDLCVFDRENGKPQTDFDVGGKLVQHIVANGWVYLTSSDGQIRALSIDNP